MADQIALGGNDFADGERGDDQIDGGLGNDKLEGNRGADQFTGQDGRDELRGGPQNDTLNGGNGRDNVDGQDGNDTLNGDAGPDDVRDSKGADAFNGGAGIDEVDARDSGGQPVGTRADKITCAGGDEVRADRNDAIVNPGRLWGDRHRLDPHRDRLRPSRPHGTQVDARRRRRALAFQDLAEQ